MVLSGRLSDLRLLITLYGNATIKEIITFNNPQRPLRKVHSPQKKPVRNNLTGKT